MEAEEEKGMTAVGKVPFLESQKALMASLRGADFLRRQVGSWNQGSFGLKINMTSFMWSFTPETDTSCAYRPLLNTVSVVE